MGKKVIIFGNTYFSVMIYNYVKQYTTLDVVAFTVDKKFISSSTICGTPVVPYENIVDLYSPIKYSFLLGLGYNHMNDLRKNKFLSVKEKGYYIESFIHPSSNISNCSIGEGNIILENVFVGPQAFIGDGNILWNGCNISHDAHIGNYNYLAPSTTFGGKVTVNNNCFFGVNSSIRSNVSIASYTLIGAGCYLNNSTAEHDVYVPSRAVHLKDKSSFDMGI